MDRDLQQLLQFEQALLEYSRQTTDLAEIALKSARASESLLQDSISDQIRTQISAAANDLMRASAMLGHDAKKEIDATQLDIQAYNKLLEEISNGCTEK